MKEQTGEEIAPPKKRRGNRRATGGSAFSGKEPHLAGLETGSREEAEAAGEDAARVAWLKEQRPPHYQGRS